MYVSTRTIVPNGSKILIWKQITTPGKPYSSNTYCSQWFKDTNLKANHNNRVMLLPLRYIVPNGSKILIWKQITTEKALYWAITDCSQWFKDTNLKANHNILETLRFLPTIVPNGSKILIWKQITTGMADMEHLFNCSQWFKDTNLKANHNSAGWLFF